MRNSERVNIFFPSQTRSTITRRHFILNALQTLEGLHLRLFEVTVVDFVKQHFKTCQVNTTIT